MSRFFAFVEGLTCKPSTWSNCLSSSFEMPLSLSISVVARITYSLVVIRFLYFIYILIFYLNTFFYPEHEIIAVRNVSLIVQFQKSSSYNSQKKIVSTRLRARLLRFSLLSLHMNHYGALFPNPTPNHLSTNYSHREIKRKERWLGIRLALTGTVTRRFAYVMK